MPIHHWDGQSRERKRGAIALQLQAETAQSPRLVLAYAKSQFSRSKARSIGCVSVDHSTT
jgi:hypothetical protein